MYFWIIGLKLSVLSVCLGSLKVICYYYVKYNLTCLPLKITSCDYCCATTVSFIVTFILLLASRQEFTLGSLLEHNGEVCE